MPTEEAIVLVGGLGTRLRAVVSDRLLSRGIDADSVDWDAWRSGERRWTVRLSYESGSAHRQADFTYDQTGSFRERIEAKGARLEPGFWRLTDARIYGINVPPTELFRISVEDAIAPITWAEYRATSNTPAIILNMMEQEKGVVPAEWFASSAAVSRAEWQAVHRWSAVLNEWEAVPIS